MLCLHYKFTMHSLSNVRYLSNVQMGRFYITYIKMNLLSCLYLFIKRAVGWGYRFLRKFICGKTAESLLDPQLYIEVRSCTIVHRKKIWQTWCWTEFYYCISLKLLNYQRFVCKSAFWFFWWLNSRIIYIRVLKNECVSS